ncbi:MAG TPA: Ig-like domain-containing protein [Verrucomicrobiae bacterium]|nr:Ig-like domain-containing protein [Verrucomicrobiae bacterium]
METKVVRDFVQDVARHVAGFLLFSILVVAQTSALATQSITLAWDPSPDPTVVGYKIYYGVVSRTYTNMVDVGNATNVTISGLIEGTTYYFAATAYNTLGMESSFSAETTYTFQVPIGNQPPTINAISNVAINEDAPQQTVNLSGITAGATNEVQTLTITASSGNTALIPNPTVNYISANTTGTLTFTPVATANGSAVITVTVNDNGASNNITTRTFTVTVNPVNDPPTLASISNVTINEDAPQQTVNLTGISTGAANEIQTLTITATSSNPGLIPNPAVNYINGNTTGTLTYTPVANSNGVSTITVTVNDGGTSNNTVVRTFTVTVTAVNDAPTLDPINNLPLIKGASQQVVNLTGISSGAPNEIQTLTVTASSSNTGLIPNPTVGYTSANTTGTLTFTPVATASGSATITVTVNDGAGNGNNNTITRTFTVTVDSPPTISAIANQTIATNSSTSALAFTIGDQETAASSLTVSASSSATGLIPVSNVVFGGSGANRTVTITPVSGQSGAATITITVSDGVVTASSAFQVTVLGSPSAPGQPIIITTSGAGSVTPNLSAASLVMGQTYTVTAVPDAGQEFAGWTGSYNSSSPQLTFLMKSNMVLQANFKASKFNPQASTYSGLFSEAAGVQLASAGSFQVSATKRGTYSGYVSLGGKRYPVSGQLDGQGQTIKTIARRGDTSLALNLWIGSGSESDKIFGQLTNQSWASVMHGNRAVFNARTNPAPYAGKYTMVIPGQSGNPANPEGDGVATVNVDTAGRVHFAGALSDGTRVSQSVALSTNGMWPLHVPLYSGNGLLMSWVAFTNQTASDLNGSLSWIKSVDPRAQYYPGGFSTECLAVGSAYTQPADANVLNLTSAQLEFSGGNLESDFTNSVTFGVRGRVSSDEQHFAMGISVGNGLFRGRVLDPSTGKARSFSGAVLQKVNAGYGFLLGTDLCSEVVLAP